MLISMGLPILCVLMLLYTMVKCIIRQNAQDL